MGLWAWRDVRFSREGTLLNTLGVLVTRAPAGLTVGELQQHLQTPVANLLSRLVQQGRLARQVLPRRQVVYLSPVAEQSRQQWEQRQETCRAAAAATANGLPTGCPAAVVIAVLRQMIMAPDQGPEQRRGSSNRKAGR